MPNVNELLKFDIGCLYSIVSPDRSKVFLSHTGSFLASYVRLKDEYPGWDWKILEEMDSHDARMLKVNYWILHYKQLNYELVNLVHRFKYKPKIIGKIIGAEYFSVVVLRSINKDDIIVGVFRSRMLAEEFVARAYPEKVVYEIRVAQNKETEEYINELEKR